MSEALHPGLPQEGGLTALRPLAQDATAGSVPPVEETLMKAVFCVPLVESPWPKRRGQCGGQAQPFYHHAESSMRSILSALAWQLHCSARWMPWAVVGSVPYDRSDRRISK
ncbi:hypothetical protein AMS68_004027 [Peltaster fructicola]|uniref:Uncharacterized protein n=1 Tax=Peltaster fructicola TaxID=286661 RepID=A0A6H0XVN8_9PEZI|nr:hypothetical protein AMS68_004027 [Peltaster fructicola]